MISIDVSDRTGQRTTFSVAKGVRLLQAGLAAGIGLPHECASGTCGSCKASVLNGNVRRLWSDAPGARTCRNANETLLCQTSADEPVELAIRTAFALPCDPPCKVQRGKTSPLRLLTQDIATFSVTLDDPLPYKPGQFVLLSGLGVEGPRAYSMTHHAPAQPELNFLVRFNSGGAFTRALFDNPLASHDVEVFGPLGRATFMCHEDRPFVAIAGGSGIAGILAILDHAIAEDHFRRHRSHLFFGLRDPENCYLLDELAHAVARSEGRLDVTVAFSDAFASEEFAARYSTLTFTKGLAHDVARENLAALNKLASKEQTKPLFFVAGPPAMVDATMRMLIVDLKISPTEVRYDRFA